MKNVYAIIALICASSLYAADIVKKDPRLTNNDLSAITAALPGTEAAKAGLVTKVATLKEMPHANRVERQTQSEFAFHLRNEISKTMRQYPALRRELRDMQQEVNKFIR